MMPPASVPTPHGELPEARFAARVVTRAVMVLLVSAAAVFAQRPERFTLGDSRERVRAVQGTPEVIERLTSLGVESWSYAEAHITFDPHTGRVVEWTDPRRRLRVELTVSAGAPQTRLSQPLPLGATRDDVVRRYGTPWAYTRDAKRRVAYMAYGRSIVRLTLDENRVDGWIVRDSAIVVAARDASAGEAAMGVRSERTASASAVAPATLRATTRWRDHSGDGALAPGESGVLSITLTNEGPGSANDVLPRVRVESPQAGVRVVSPPVAPTILSGTSRVFDVRLTADSAQAATEIVVLVDAQEGHGFDLAPALRVRIPARPAGTPLLVLRDMRVDDASRDGRLAPREVADVTLRIANTGTGASPPLRAHLRRGADLFVAGGMPDTFALGVLPAGGTAHVSLVLYTNSRAADTWARLELADPTGRILARLPIELPLNNAAATVVDMALGDDPSTNETSAARTPLAAEVERGMPRRASRRSDAIAVILGVERYKSLPDARYAARDAALMRRYAVEAMGVSDDPEHLYVRTDADVTSGELRKVFGETGWLARRVDDNTDLLVYFAGHGAPDAARSGPFLLPFDADAAFVRETGYALGDLYDRLARLRARSITIVLDACFTGMTRGLESIVPGARPTVLSIEHPALVRRNMAVLSAARDAQVAGDLPSARHGLFTWFVARGLRGEADGDADGAITIAELGRFVERGVSAAAGRLDREQRPLLIARDSLRVLTRLAPER
ncbi:MAG: caspase family protein [Gemmatimonadaceae bacterium]